MGAQFFNYSAILGRAMQQVVHSVLSYVAENGLPGQHHFYIGFNTAANGVVLPPRILEKYPEQITIVLQHEFYDLVVNRNDFEVGLIFDGDRELVVVPFDSLTEFSDPFANFSMQFDVGEWGGAYAAIDDDAESDDSEDDTEDDMVDNGEDILRNMNSDLTVNLSNELLQSIRAAERNSDGNTCNKEDRRDADIIYIDDYKKK